MKHLFNHKLLMLAIGLFIATACGDDDEVKTKGNISLDSEQSSIASGWFMYDTSPNHDIEENVYYRNQIIFFGKGLKFEKDGDEYETTGSGDVLELYINNEGQLPETGIYTWQGEENEQPFDLWYGLYTQNVNTGDEATYRLQSGTLTISKSGSTYKMSFEGTAYLEIGQDFKQSAGLPPIAVTAEFEGKLKKAKFDF